MIVVDADFLGRGRTGDETYVENLLRALAPLRGRAAGSRRSRATRRSSPTGSSRSS